MNTITEIMDITQLTEVEVDVVHEKLSDPVVRKYFKLLARTDLEELLQLPVSIMDDTERAKKHALVQGKISVYATLLTIK
jgi:hypothetical protein